MKMSPRTTLIIIAGLFLSPLILAWLMWAGVIDFNPSQTRNKGNLVQPPVPLAWDDQLSSTDLAKHWIVLHLVPDPCSEECIEAISALRQVHMASGRDQSRIRMVLLLQDSRNIDADGRLQEIYPLFKLVGNPGGSLFRDLDTIASAFSSTAQGSSYVVDPIGNIMLFYGAGSDPNDLKDDLKRLLTWSKLDK